MAAARTRAVHLPGPPPVEPAVGALLAVLAAGSAARSVVSIGSGGGLVGLWLLRGMRPDGVLPPWTATRSSCAPRRRRSPTPASPRAGPG